MVRGKNYAFISGFFLIFIEILLSFQTFCQSSNPSDKPDSLNYKIALWFQFKDAAVTITFDDGIRSHFTTAVPMLNERSLKGSFYVVTNFIGKGFTPGWDTLNEVARQGHEIGSHSMNHANMSNLAAYPKFADSLRKELSDSRDIINRNIPSQKCESFCWPGGAVSPLAIDIAKRYYLACRASGNLLNYAGVQDFYNIQSLPIYHNTLLSTANYWIDQAIQVKGWLIERIHGIKTGKDSTGYEPVPVNVLKNHWDYIVKNEKQLWVATFSNVIKYIRERDGTKLKIIDYQNGNFRISISNNLPDSAYYLPLSLKIKLIGLLNNFREIQQNGRSLQYEVHKEITKKDTVNYVVFEAIPDKGDITIYIPIEFITNYREPFGSAVQITFGLTRRQKVKLCVYNSEGKIVKHSKRKFNQGVNNIKFDGRKLADGTYPYSLECDKGYIYWSKLILKKDGNVVSQKGHHL